MSSNIAGDGDDINEDVQAEGNVSGTDIAIAESAETESVETEVGEAGVGEVEDVVAPEAEVSAADGAWQEEDAAPKKKGVAEGGSDKPEAAENVAAEEDSESALFEDENIDEAYDFESGELIDNDPHAGIPSRNIISTSKEFFNSEILYRYDILEDPERELLKGSYQINLAGDEKETWSLQLDQDISINSDAAESQPKSDATLSMTSSDFVLLVNGDLNPQLAFLSEKVSASGSLEKALALQLLLAPAVD